MLCQTAFTVIPPPHVLPTLLTLRKSFPRSMPAAASHTSNSLLTQSGTGTGRTWPPLPIKSTMAQCSSRCWRRSIVNATASCLLSPHASRRANKAQSRFPFSRSRSGACQSACPCSAVSQLPRRTPNFFTPLTRRILAAKSAGTEQTAIGCLTRKTAYGTQS